MLEDTLVLTDEVKKQFTITQQLIIIYMCGTGYFPKRRIYSDFLTTTILSVEVMCPSLYDVSSAYTSRVFV